MGGALGTPGNPVGDAGRAALGIVRDAGDTRIDITRRHNYEDLVAAKGSVINIDHRGDGTGNVGSPGQTYGVDIHNFPGARSALVIHQYSQSNPAFLLDNCGNQPAIEINNTANEALAPGTDGTGDFLRFRDHGTSVMQWNKDNVLSVTKTVVIVNQNATVLSAQTAGNWTALDVVKGTGARVAVQIANSGTGRSILVKAGSTDVAGINADGEYEHLTAGKGLLLKSPDGTRYRVSVANGGTVSVVAAP